MIGIGSNLPSLDGTRPIVTARHAIITLSHIPGLDLVGLSRWYESDPIPASSQPLYINGVAHLRGRIEPAELLAILQRIEAQAGRSRGQANAARTLDLDIIAIGDLVRSAPDPILPHPRAHLRAFVLQPLADVMPNWVHPHFRLTLPQMLAALPAQGVRLMQESV
jgi:2-amino-4-hydroxy-6-hydroxymethyldihydropteridine diphosphokinase